MIEKKQNDQRLRFFGENSRILSEEELTKEQTKRSPRAALRSGDKIKFFGTPEEHFIAVKPTKIGGKLYDVPGIPAILQRTDASGNTKEIDLIFYVSWLSNTGFSVLAYMQVENGDEDAAINACIDAYKANTNETPVNDTTNVNLGRVVEIWQRCPNQAEALAELSGQTISVVKTAFYCDRFTEATPKAVLRFEFV